MCCTADYFVARNNYSPIASFGFHDDPMGFLEIFNVSPSNSMTGGEIGGASSLAVGFASAAVFVAGLASSIAAGVISGVT